LTEEDTLAIQNMDYAQIEENMAIYEQAVALNDSAGEQILYQTVEALILVRRSDEVLR